MVKKIKLILSYGVFSLLLLFGFIFNCGASTVTTEDIVINSNDIYKYYHKTKPLDEWVSGKEVMKKIKVDNNDAFCIDFGPVLKSGDGFVESYLDNYMMQLVKSTDTMREAYDKINLYLNAYKTAGLNSLPYYLATQKLVWQEINDLDVWTYPEGSNFERIKFENKSLIFTYGKDKKDNAVDISSQLSSIQTYASDYYIAPKLKKADAADSTAITLIEESSLNGKVVNLGKYNESVSLVDVNDVIRDFDMSYYTNNSDIISAKKNTTNKDQIDIVLDGEAEDGDYIVISLSKGNNAKTLLYTKGSSQRVIKYNGGLPNIGYKFIVYFKEKLHGGLVVSKRDLNTNEFLAGTKFELYQENDKTTSIANCTTNDKGFCTFADLNVAATNDDITDAHKYCIKEVDAPEGYNIDNTDLVCKTLSLGEGYNAVYSVVFKDSKKTGNLKLLKIDSKSEDGLAGVEFKLLNDDDDELMTFVTNEDGEYDIYNLLPGSYTLKEIKALDGYDMTDPVEFEIVANEDKVVTIKNDKLETVVTGDLPLIIVITTALLSLSLVVVMYTFSRAKKAYNN